MLLYLFIFLQRQFCKTAFFALGQIFAELHPMVVNADIGDCFCGQSRIIWKEDVGAEGRLLWGSFGNEKYFD